ncbi:MAG TPA: EAL domain-containing protein, partial [Clostridia bacterium]|nr:EAL domain-containing protein [Clostridia bacterium]
MDYFLARQPIFKRNLTVYAYELLFRSNPKENSYTPESSESILNVDGYDSDDQSTSKVLINSYLAEDFESFSQGKKVFINFTEHLIMDETPLIFPNETLVIELLETIKPNQVLVEKCSNLKKKGYTLALDDYVHERDKGNPLLELVDVLKVDFLDNTKKEISQIARLYKNRPFELLAEKVESDEMFQFAKEEGFHYFQGYFFSKP